ncbi:MAG TPA: helix-turn-helix domain-containing protein, partial [Streptosporangiaceae bacterium]
SIAHNQGNLMSRPLRAPVLAVCDGTADAVRAHILGAARRVIAERGLAAASTRAIAEQAGVAGGTLYNYFDGHTDLVAKSIVRHASDLTGAVSGLAQRAGQGTVEQNLRWFARQAVTVLDELVPAYAAAFSDSALLAAVRSEVAAGLAEDPAAVVERYLGAERDLGRVAPDTDCRTVASIVVSLCHDNAFQRHLRGPGEPGPDGEAGPDGEPIPRVREIDLIARAVTAQPADERQES